MLCLYNNFVIHKLGEKRLFIVVRYNYNKELRFVSFNYCMLLFLGTPFMVRLHHQLKFFVNYKISTDRAWQGLRIFLSGHEVFEFNFTKCFSSFAHFT